MTADRVARQAARTLVHRTVRTAARDGIGVAAGAAS